MLDAHDNLIYYIQKNKDYLNLTDLTAQDDGVCVARLMPKMKTLKVGISIGETAYKEIKKSNLKEEAAFFAWIDKRVNEIIARNV